MALAPAARFLKGEPQDPDAKFSAGVKVVNVFATVRDKKGQIVRDLNKEDFLIEEEGRAQTIRYFTRETDLPLTLGLLIDTSGSTSRVLPEERSASHRFLEQVLREDKDLAFIIHFDFEVELLQDVTSSREKLEEALGELQTGAGGPRWGQRGAPRGGRRAGRFGGTSLYDAVLLASDELMKKQSGRKALILLTDGMDNGSKVSLEQAEESAQRADTLVYSILFEDQEMVYRALPPGGMGRRGGWGGPGPRIDSRDGRKVLQELARNTGGRFFEVGKRQPIQKVFADIEEDLRNQYNLGYTPEGGDSSGAFRHIHVTTKQKGLSVQAREGYYPT